MRKTTFVRAINLCVCLLCLVALGIVCLPAFAQDAAPAVAPTSASASAPAKDAPAAVALPTDPKALLLLAAKLNGLHGNDLKPWHLKISFTSFDEKEKESEKGSIEEFWVSPAKFKVVRISSKSSQTDYGTEKGIMRSGEQSSMPGVFVEVTDQFINPFHFNNVQNLRDSAKTELHEKSFGKVQLRCLTTIYSAANSQSITTFDPTVCMELNIPAMRVLGPMQAGRIFFYNDLSIFQERYIAHLVECLRDGKKDIVAHLDVLEEIKSLDEAEFTPPPDATLLQKSTIFAPGLAQGKTITISPVVAQGQLIKASAPFYPIGAKAMRVSGTVVVAATIGKDGHINGAHAVSGSELLRDAAVESVKKWVYKPYMLNGEAVEVRTTVNVIFTLND